MNLPSSEYVCPIVGVIFMATLGYWIVGQIALYFWLRRRGVELNRFFGNVPLYPMAVYYRNRPEVGTRHMDTFVLSTIIAMAIGLLSWVLAFPLGVCMQ